MARNHCTDTKYYRTSVLRNPGTEHERRDQFGPYSAKGTATAQLKRELRLAGSTADPERSYIEVTNPIEWGIAD